MTAVAPPAARTAPIPRRQRPALAQWAADLALGVRLSVSGGRAGWVRLALIAVGIGLGVAMLLVAAARDTGAAVVLVTHEARVAAYADREAVVRDGRVRQEVLAR